MTKPEDKAARMPVGCDAVRYQSAGPEADYDLEVPCTEAATVEVPLSDGRLHPRCKQHIPIMLRALARPL